LIVEGLMKSFAKTKRFCGLRFCGAALRIL